MNFLAVFAIMSLSRMSLFENLWPLPSVLVCIFTAITLMCLRKTNWFGTLSIQNKTALTSLGLGVLSFIGVALWVYLAHPSTGDIPFKFPSSMSFLSATGLLILFSVANSFAEEFIFRGLALESMVQNSPFWANLLQALSFGLFHYKGFPFGPFGSLLAFLFALMMGTLKIRSRSLIYPWLAHFTANIAMGLLLYQMSS